MQRGRRGHRRPAWLDDPDQVMARALTKVLRHSAREMHVPIAPDGFVALSDLRKLPAFQRLDAHKLAQIVHDDNKNRFFVEERAGGELFIRANQGHSLSSVDALELVPIQIAQSVESTVQSQNTSISQSMTSHSTVQSVNPFTDERFDQVAAPESMMDVIHGTTREKWELIRRSGGLSRMKRNHIHFSRAVPGVNGRETVAGARASSTCFIFIDIAAALRDGFQFFKSKNDVILCPGNNCGILPIKYVTKVVLKDGSKLYP